MKKISLLLMTVLAAWSFQACNNEASRDASETAENVKEGVNEGVNDVKEGANNVKEGVENSMATNTTMQEVDTKFMMKAASGGMMEVELGQMAQQKAQSQRVKDFGAMMVRDHTQANNELKALAANKNVSVPAAMTEEHQGHVNGMREKTGKDFDKAYMSMMVDDHEKDVSDYSNESNNGSDAEVKAFAAKTLPVLRAHLDSAKSVNDAVKK